MSTLATAGDAYTAVLLGPKPSDTFTLEEQHLYAALPATNSELPQLGAFVRELLRDEAQADDTAKEDQP